MKLRLFLIGFGTVGQGFAELLLNKKEELKERYDLEPAVVAISDLKLGALSDARGIDLSLALKNARQGKPFAETNLPVKELTTEQLLAQADYDVAIELTPTNLKTGEPALGFIREALNSGHHVITTNKGPCALYLSDLLQLAREKGVQFRYEGTVMAGTPLLNLIESGLAGLSISKLEGIVNGTCNYILTQMESGMPYGEALKQAQELGYAEANPEADVEGWDAVAKVMILAQALFSRKLRASDIERAGITGITPEDIATAQKENATWKLIASVEKKNGQIRASVKPQKIPNNHPLAGVKGATNAATFTTDFLNLVTIIGPGAGRFETGYAVLNDLIAIHNNLA